MPSDPVSRDIQIPMLNLTNGPITSIEQGPLGFYTNVSSSLKQTINSIMTTSPEASWTPPDGCGAACSFEFEYDAPALDCRPTTLDEYRLSPGILMIQDHKWVYEANSTLSPNLPIYPTVITIPLPAFRWDTEGPYDLSINYAVLKPGSNLVSQVGGGAYCTFRNATYRASFTYVNNTQSISTSILSYGNVLGRQHDCRPFVTAPTPPTCWIRAVNTRAICDAFASALQGHIGYGDTATVGGNVQSSFTTGGVSNVAFVQTIFDITVSYENVAALFKLSVPDLSKALVDSFSNITLSLIPYRRETTSSSSMRSIITVKATVWDGTNVWHYTTWTLWIIYLPALLLALPIIIGGIKSILSENGMAVEDAFSTMLLATRNPRLDEACVHAERFEDLQRVRLLRRKGCSFVVVEDE